MGGVGGAGRVGRVSVVYVVVVDGVTFLEELVATSILGQERVARAGKCFENTSRERKRLFAT